jgi:hypothetical protein
MFSSFYKKPFFNKVLSDYCFESTIKSIQNMIETQKKLEKTLGTIIWNNNKERLTYDNSMILFKNPNPNPNNPYIIVAISIPFIYFFYKSIREVTTYR